MSKTNHAIIAFEGLDCSFKETNYKNFVSKLKEQREESGFVIHTESFPRYGNPMAAPLEYWLQYKMDRAILKQLPFAVDSLYSIDRLDYWYHCDMDGTKRTMINTFIPTSPDDITFHYFVFDRYNLSNAVYNPLPGGFEEDLQFDNKYFNIPHPDVVVWMRVNNFDKIVETLSAKENRDKNETDIMFLKQAWDRSEEMIAGGYIQKYTGATLVVVDVLDDNGEFKTRKELTDFIWREVNVAVARKCM